MPSADDSFKPDKIIKAKKGESSWKVAANERTRIMLPHFIDLVRWEGVGWPRVLAPGATVTVVADCVNFGQGSGVDITVSDSEGNFEETIHRTVYGYDAKLQFRVPNNARGLLLVKVSIPKSDRPDWDAGLEEGDLEQMAPAIKIVPSLLQQVRFDKEEVTEGEEVTMTVQTSRDKDRYRGRFEIGRLEKYGGKDVFIRHAGPFYKYPEKAGGYEVTWTVTTPMIDRSEITARPKGTSSLRSGRSGTSTRRKRRRRRPAKRTAAPANTAGSNSSPGRSISGCKATPPRPAVPAQTGRARLRSSTR